MPRRIALLVAAIAALVLAACGGSDKETAPTTAASAVVTSAVTSATGSTSTTTFAPSSSLAPSSSSTTHAATTPPPTTSAATSTVAAGTSPVGFGTIGLAIRAAGGASKTFCLWLADTDARRERGLMQVTSLGGKSGMIFTYGSDTNEQFWMYQTVMPLSIAFFDSTGAFVSAADMAPCPGAPSTCPSYPAAGKYRDAIEVPQGGLAALGIGPGSALTDRGSCPA